MTGIETAIGELVDQIRVRQDALKALQALGCDLPPAPAATATNRTNKPKASGKWSRAPRPEVLAACAKLTQPFDAPALAAAAGLKAKAAQNQLMRWCNKGLLKRMGPGRYERTAQFPANGAGPGEPPAPTVNAAEVKSLEAQIQAACRERDNAVASGRDKLAKILQDKVDKLQRQLEEQES
jgi:hypothetical protein